MKSLRTLFRYGMYSTAIVLGITVISIMIFPYRWLGERVFQDVHDLHQADAIVVLFHDYNEDDTGVNRESQRRVSYGVKLFQEGYAKNIIFSGGRPKGAKFMAQLGEQLGVPPQNILIENRSRDTISNWENTSRIVKAHQWNSVLLVSSVFHIARAVRIINPKEITIYPAAVPYNSCDPPHTRLELMRSLFHNFGTYVLYVVAGERNYERIVDYVRRNSGQSAVGSDQSAVSSEQTGNWQLVTGNW
jgi:uncharacterized SAM-binding protein YcdF (DUF218 family)